ncbi:hypothetical protein CSOJ01_06169 [Colletotrichum sojae]|uniref:Uncharacterized protein n=1 Tax=Colletotrichum sojae TaxID=2175907 RepID=A0A8H6MWE2_9PEZI|nr:hypothetical protein CSOJ01_06169 [Colletotrichum sojae]
MPRAATLEERPGRRPIWQERSRSTSAQPLKWTVLTSSLLRWKWGRPALTCLTLSPACSLTISVGAPPSPVVQFGTCSLAGHLALAVAIHLHARHHDETNTSEYQPWAVEMRPSAVPSDLPPHLTLAPCPLRLTGSWNSRGLLVGSSSSSRAFNITRALTE